MFVECKACLPNLCLNYNVQYELEVYNFLRFRSYNFTKHIKTLNNDIYILIVYKSLENDY